MILLAAGFAYVLGGLQAIVVGLTLAFQFTAGRPRPGPRPAVVAGLATGLAFFFVTLGQRGSEAWTFAHHAVYALYWIAVHVGAALGCWALCLALFARGQTAPDQQGHQDGAETDRK